ncbi:MAG: cardiolipin synthase B [Nitrospirae bacterium]|nr:MAG: cardiolipin synthase B [Nitrospirota bacterium]
MQCENFSVPQIEEILKTNFSDASGIRLLWKGKESFQSIFEAVRNAKKFICLVFYIFRNDETGNALANILKQKSIEGVQVYVLYDHFGSFQTPIRFWHELSGAGVQIKASRPFKWTSPGHYVHRDHRKLIIIDGEKAFTGGLNIANEYSGFHLRIKGRGWRDTGVMLEGPIVQDLFAHFEKSWRLWGGKSISNSPATGANNKKGIAAIPVFVSSIRSRRRMRKLLYHSINNSTKSISLTTAYFIPSRMMLETLEGAVKRGVKVRLIVPDISDVPIASYAGKASYTRLLKAGVEIYAYQGEILHAKTYLFDDCWSIIGSTNLDFQSLRYNDEGNVGIYDKGLGRQMAGVFEEDIKKAKKINPDEWRNRPFIGKFLETFCALFRRRL